MVKEALRTLRDWRWHMRARAARGMSLDRVRTQDSAGYTAEVVQPRWWDLGRWWEWLFQTDGHFEAVLHGPDGVPHFFLLRTRRVPAPPPPRYEFHGRTLVARPEPKVEPGAAVLYDPDKRLVPDEVLERDGITVRER